MYKIEPSSSFPHRRRTPSFSSSLLDAIYRSFDESDSITEEPTSSHYRGTAAAKKQSVSTHRKVKTISNLDREIMNENWVGEKKKKTSYGSSSSSFDTNSDRNGMFSSSAAAESSHRRNSRRKTAAPVMPTKCLAFYTGETEFSRKPQKPQREGGFTKTKLKALKMYSELKKVKQPISPSGRISAFLNSIFNGNAKKVKICSVGAMDDVRELKSECLSAPPFSRSFISTSSSSNTKKRSVRFSNQDPSFITTPTISVHQIQKVVKNSSRKDEVLKNFVMKKESVYLRHYQKKGMREFHYDDENEDDDGDVSCSSSELFELDHLIGIGRHREELPVYETTDFRTKQAIANGFVF